MVEAKKPEEIKKEKPKRSEFHFRLWMTDEEKSSLKTREKNLKEKYGVKKTDVIRCFLVDHLDNGKILFLMGFFPPKKK